MNQVINKLPQITLMFWIIKIFATTLGETGGDLLAQTMNVGYGVSSMILVGIFVATLLMQLSAKSFHPFLYWTVILSTSLAGTTMSDYIDRSLGMGYASGSAMLITLLLLILAAWKYSVGSLSVTNVNTRKGELFYWFAILVSNTLGTALGDYLADDSGLGFAGGALFISSLIMLIILAKYFTKISHIALFWAAFVLTRPFGATMGDLLTKPIEKGGMDLGTIGASAVLGTVLVLLIIISSRSYKKASSA